MKKKSLIVLMTVTLVIAAFGLVGPASAKQPNNVRAVFEADIVPATTGDHPLVKGEVWIRESGHYKVEIEGARPDTTYRVFLVFGVPITSIELEPNDPLVTDEKGEGKLIGIGEGLCYNGGGYAGPWIEIRCEGEVQFVSGFALETCTESEPGPVEPPNFL